jgi:thiol-disulfide isomerase/thioredoxin
MRAHRLNAVIALTLGLFALTAASAQAFETKPYDEASFKSAQSAGKPILVDVFAPWCPTCKAQHQVLETLKDKPGFADITVYQVDFDNQKDAVRGFNAQRQSTLIAFKGDTETARSVGATSTADIEELLQSTLQ